MFLRYTIEDTKKRRSHNTFHNDEWIACWWADLQIEKLFAKMYKQINKISSKKKNNFWEGTERGNNSKSVNEKVIYLLQ